MSEFMVKLQQAEKTGEELKAYSVKLESLKHEALSIMHNLSISGDPSERIKDNLSAIAGRIEGSSKTMKLMGNQLISIADLYRQAEERIINNADGKETMGSKVKDSKSFWNSIVDFFGGLFGGSKKKQVTEYEIDSIVFDDSGSYGGDQGSPQYEADLTEREELYDIVRKYYPKLTDKQIMIYLQKLNSEGCGYVAIINTIMAAYEGREKEFEKTFGFPMYGEDGDLNYDRLLVDFYTATDNHQRSWFFWDKTNNMNDYDKDIDGDKRNYDYWSDSTGTGTSEADREYLTEMYLSDHGVDANVKTNINITPENFKEYAEDGKYVIVAFRYGNLYNMDGTPYMYIDGGHAMVVTGVTEDGYLKVSSWGGEYYIVPNEVCSINNHKTSFSFSTIQYDK